MTEQKLFFPSGPNGTPFHPHVAMENKLEEKHKKGKRKNLPTDKTPKRTYRNSGNVSELVDTPLQTVRSIAGGTPWCLERDREPWMHMMEEQSKESPKLQWSQPKLVDASLQRQNLLPGAHQGAKSVIKNHGCTWWRSEARRTPNCNRAREKTGCFHQFFEFHFITLLSIVTKE